MARIFIAETRGAVLPELTPESVRDNLSLIEDADDYLVPESLAEATEIIAKALS